MYENVFVISRLLHYQFTRRRNKMKKSRRIAFLIISLLFVTLACSISLGAEEAPVVVIVLPAEGETVTVGQVVHVVATVTSDLGLDKVKLLVNGQVNATEDLTGDPTSYSTNFSWVPASEGGVVLGVIGYDADGNPSEAALRSVQVSGSGGAVVPQDPAEETSQAATEQTIMCTPPACSANEAYYCSGACPGGCGISCATFTPTNPPPSTATFTPLPPTKTITPTPKNTPEFQVVISPGVVYLQPTVVTESGIVQIPPGNYGWKQVDCPSNGVAVSGGFHGDQDLFVYTNRGDTNSWSVYAKNLGSTTHTLTVHVRCLLNTLGHTFHASSISQVPAGEHQRSVRACPEDRIVTGGGYSISGSSNMVVYNSSMKDNGWQVWAQNNDNQSRQINVYAVCLSGVNAATRQISTTVSIPAGMVHGGYTRCGNDEFVVGGGFAGQRDFIVTISTPFAGQTNEWVASAFNPGATDQNFYNYAICLDFD
jgi:hypothetical protein